MNRNPLPDFLKGFAVFLIIPVHILETLIDYPGRESLFGKILLFLGGPVAVPIFMMVMGYFVAISKKSTTQNLVRGALIFLLGFLLNIGMNFHLLLKIKFAGWQFDPLQYIFGVDIFYLAGIAIMLLSILKNIKKGQLAILFALIIFVSATTSYLNSVLLVADSGYILPFIAGKYSWSYFPLFPWLAYPLLGFLFQKLEKQLRIFFQKKKVISYGILASVLLLVLLFSNYGIETTINLTEYYHHSFLFFLWTLGVDILWFVLLWLLVQKFAEFPLIVFLRWLGKNITIFYVIQWLIIGNIATAIYQTQELSTYGYWFSAIFLITIIITYLYEKIKLKNIRSTLN